VAATAPARAGGVWPGLPLADARARVPDLVSEPVDRQADGDALRALTLWMIRWSPVAAVDGLDGAMLDITGVAHLFGGEAGLLADISRSLDRLGLTHRLAIADTPGAAWALAHEGRAQLTRLDGPAEAGIADLPAAGLRLGPEALALLRRFGLTRIGQLYGIDRKALTRRFALGETADRVMLRLDQALGRVAEPLAGLAEPAEHRVRLDCPEPIGTREAVEEGLGRLMADLAHRLESAGLGARRFRLSAFRSDGTVSEVSIATARPERAPAHLLRLFGERLDRIDPGFGIDLLVLEASGCGAHDTAPRPLTRDLARDPVDPAALSALADRLTVRLGDGAVQVIEPVASHLPERSDNIRAFLGHLPNWPPEGSLPDPAGPARPLTLLDRPEPVNVVAEILDGPPMRFLWRRVMRRVAKAEGPERIGPEWWRAEGRQARTRDYYRVEDQEGGRYWIYRDGLYGDGRGGMPVWYLHGIFG